MHGVCGQRWPGGLWVMRNGYAHVKLGCKKRLELEKVGFHKQEMVGWGSFPFNGSYCFI
jgi:hypothetical protein